MSDPYRTPSERDEYPCDLLPYCRPTCSTCKRARRETEIPLENRVGGILRFIPMEKP